jgi:hypothetical protein
MVTTNVADLRSRIRITKLFIPDPGSGSQKFSSWIPDPTVHKKRGMKINSNLFLAPYGFRSKQRFVCAPDPKIIEENLTKKHTGTLWIRKNSSRIQGVKKTPDPASQIRNTGHTKHLSLTPQHAICTVYVYLS